MCKEGIFPEKQELLAERVFGERNDGTDWTSCLRCCGLTTGLGGARDQ